MRNPKPISQIRALIPLLMASVPCVGLASPVTIYQTNYTSGFTAGKLGGQNGWLYQQQIAVVDPVVGSVSSIGGPWDRNLYGNGARGGTSGIPNAAGTFLGNSSLILDFDYQFTLPSNSNSDLANVGFANTIPTGGGAPTIDFGFDSKFVSSTGSVVFFPDRNDTANGDALILTNANVGINPGASDFTSDVLRVSYRITKTGTGTWTVTAFSVLNLTTSQNYVYSGPTQAISYSGTDAFFYQQLAPTGNTSFTGITKGVTFSYDDGYNPAALPVHGITLKPTAQDLDGNGLPDVWEALYGANGIDPLADSDGDGVSNANEAGAGTDPFDPQSVLKARVANSAPGQVKLFWNALDQRPGQAETSTTLSTGSWQNQSGSPTLQSGEWRLTLNAADPARFFRIRPTESDTDSDGVPDWIESYLGFSKTSSSSVSKPVSYDTNNDELPDTNLSGDLSAFNQIYRLSETGTRLTRAQAARFLMQATFGAATPADVDNLAGKGVETWIDEQVALPPTTTSPYILAIKADFAIRKTGGSGDPAIAGYNAGNPTAPTDFVFGTNFKTSWARNALSAPDQLRQRVAFALSEILVASRSHTDLANQIQATAHYYDHMVNYAFGNYEDLLLQVSLSPYMGIYLSHRGNRKADLSIGRFPDENYAREVMQLFSIGLWELNPDGTRKSNGSGEPIATYDNGDITNLARVFTGVNYAANSFNGGWRDDATFMTTPMIVYATEHDFDVKTVVSGNGNHYTIPVRTPTDANGLQDVKDAIHQLVIHPNTAPFISRQLIQFLVTSNPTPAYVQRVSSVFVNNGSGGVGDLEAVVRAILLDPEARDPMRHLSTPWFGQLREPTVRAMHLARLLKIGNHSNLLWWDFGTYAAESLQEPMNSPSVFNYYRPDYRLYGILAENELDSPAFGITDAYSSISFPNNLWTICNTGFKHPNGDQYYPEQAEDLTDLDAISADIPALLDHLSLLFCGGTLSAQSRAIISTSLAATSNLSDRSRLAAYLVLNSPEGTCLK